MSTSTDVALLEKLAAQVGTPFWLYDARALRARIAKVKALLEEPAETIQVFIITTKEGRFVEQLLQQAGVAFPRAKIFGKESKRPKHQTLRELMHQAQRQSARPIAIRCRSKIAEVRLRRLQVGWHRSLLGLPANGFGRAVGMTIRT